MRTAFHTHRFIGISLAVLLCGIALPTQALKPVWRPDEPLTDSSGDARSGYAFARSVTTDGAGRIHVIWGESRDGTAHIFYRRSSDKASLWGEDQRLSGMPGLAAHPSIAAFGSSVFAVWELAVAGQPTRVFFTRSTNAGSAWAVPIQVAEGVQPSLAAVGTVVHLTWVSERKGAPAVYYRRSVDGGLTWEPEQRFTEVSKESGTPSIAASEATTVVAYVNTRDGNTEVYVRRSGDAGQTWANEERITKNRMASGPPSVAVTGQTVHLVWADQKANGGNLGDAERQLDEIMRLIGLSFTSESIKKTQANVFDTDAQQARIDEKRQRVQAAVPIWNARGGNPLQIGAMLQEVDHLVAVATREWDLYYRRSEDGGLVWEKEVRLTATPGTSWQPSVGTSGETTQLVWIDNRDGAPAVYHTASQDNGRTWGPQTRLTDAPSIADNPSLSVTSRGTSIVWSDRRGGRSQVYYKGLMTGEP